MKQRNSGGWTGLLGKRGKKVKRKKKRPEPAHGKQERVTDRAEIHS